MGDARQRRERRAFQAGATAATKARRQGRAQSAGQWGAPKAGKLWSILDRRLGHKNQRKVDDSQEKRINSLPFVKYNPTSKVNTPLLELVELWVEDFLILGILRNNLIVVH